MDAERAKSKWKRKGDSGNSNGNSQRKLRMARAINCIWCDTLCESEWVGVCYFTNSTEMIHGVDGQEIEGDRKMNIKYIFENGGWKENKNETETFPQFV